ncbi:hypothetical protein [Saccharospirillum salsuginis]|uniref:DUF2946 domain-containing protein n=1 Tax=Saccharospirillum salsuginis TaxID=418750 RepID=A0A918N897_9GAMM|nr:hypothetical protein [Saccharospirillum salsuginis]GGX47203.1 hypothetical protein GCM10007392_12530 [Saccharospirillum salsuginis]
MICRTYTALPVCLLLAVCLVQFGSAVQWHELEHLGERLTQVEVPNSEPDGSDDSVHGLCKVCVSLKTLALADSSVKLYKDTDLHSVLRLKETAGSSFTPDWPPTARGPPTW